MHVEIGPVSAASARAWIAYATEILSQAQVEPGPTPPAALTRMRAYLDEWDTAAAAGDPFRWSGEAPPEIVEYLIHALYQLGVRVEEEAAQGRARLRPPEADKFHIVLVRSVLDALEHEGPAQAQLAESLRQQWGPIARAD